MSTLLKTFLVEDELDASYVESFCYYTDSVMSTFIPEVFFSIARAT